MAIKRKSKINPNFNMSSMTDIFFLLLLFFMISSTLINPNALKLLLPKSTNQTSDKPVTVVSIDKNYTFYLNEKVIPFSMLERRLVEELRELEDPCISLQADKSVPLEQIVKVMNIAKDHNYRLILSNGTRIASKNSYYRISTEQVHEKNNRVAETYRPSRRIQPHK